MVKQGLVVGVVGTGAVARALVWATAPSTAGRRVREVRVVSRSIARARSLASAVGAVAARPADLGVCDVVLVAVPDGAIPSVGSALARAGVAAPVLHTSGALEGSALGGGVRSGSLHPLQSFPRSADGPTLAARLRGACVFHEGAGAAAARRLAGIWGSEFHSLGAGGKALYHAAAAMVSNHTVALFADALRLFEAAGVPSAAGPAALAPLLQGTADNIAALGPARALTGPVVRGDAAVVALHVARIAADAPELSEAYAAMARRALALAVERRDLGEREAAAVRRALEPAVRPARRRPPKR